MTHFFGRSLGVIVEKLVFVEVVVLVVALVESSALEVHTVASGSRVLVDETGVESSSDPEVSVDRVGSESSALGVPVVASASCPVADELDVDSPALKVPGVASG